MISSLRAIRPGPSNHVARSVSPTARSTRRTFVAAQLKQRVAPTGKEAPFHKNASLPRFLKDSECRAALSGARFGQLLQRIGERHAERREMAFVGGEDGEAVCCGRGGDGDVFEAGVMRPC